jgi:hypothetical protein
MLCASGMRAQFAVSGKHRGRPTVSTAWRANHLPLESMRCERGGTMRQYYEDLLIDALLDRGFTIEEAQHLIALQERVARQRQGAEQAGDRRGDAGLQDWQDGQSS